MEARLHVAAMDHNFNIQREAATTTEGHLQYKLEYSKGAKSYITKPIKMPKDCSLKTELLDGMKHRCSTGYKI